MAHKLSFACAEMILSYHLLPQLIFFTHKLGSVTSLLGVLCWCLLLCVLVFVLVFCCVVSRFFFVCFLMNVTVHWTMYRSSTSLLLRPLQHRPLRDLINQLISNATCFETC